MPYHIIWMRFTRLNRKTIQNQIFRLLVVNAMEATAVTTWKEKLSETSAKLKVTVYGDWTGGMFVGLPDER